MYFHGNAEDLGRTQDFLKCLQRYLQVHIIAPEYPGYGIYPGSATEQGIIEDADSVFKFLTDTIGWHEDDIIMCGRSIGAGPACHLASRHNPSALLLVSPPMSIKGVVGSILGSWSKFLVKERFNNLEAIKLVSCPTFLLHGKKDGIVPWTHSDALCQNCGGPTMLLLSEAMDHNSFDFMEDLVKPFA